MTAKPQLEVSAAIITNGSEILCFQKGESKRSYLSYKYEFPGGKLEPGESPAEALIRELSEELDLKIEEQAVSHFADLTHEYDDFSVLIHYMIVECQNPEYTLKEHVSAVWRTPESVADLDWAGADMEAAKLLGAKHE